jgi:hypothetical protein
MALNHLSGISVESWVELDAQVPVSYEVDRLNNDATLFFGANNDFVLKLNRKNLGQLLELGQRAAADLDRAE